MREPADRREQAWFRLREFQERAHEILNCQLAQRADLATVGHQIQVLKAVEDAGYQLVREQPPEFEITDAAAKIRPVFLEQEPVFHGKVMRSLGWLTTAEH